jgi:glycolate oxidase FAD binding subunit
VSAGDLRAALEAELGTDAVRDTDEATRATGVALLAQPPSGDGVSAVLRLLGERGATALIRGQGTQDLLGNTMDSVDVLLSTMALRGVDELDRQDGVVHVGAGTTLGEVAAAARPEGWELPLGAPAESSVGGALSIAAVGPRHLGQGPPRDCVLGLEFVLGSSERTRCGGRVVKNVTGFDLAKLYTGSFGCLGVIESGWLRLQPAPEVATQRVAMVAPEQDPVGLAIAVSRRPSTRCCVLLDDALAREVGAAAGEAGPDEVLMLVEFAGSAPGVEDDVRWLADASTVRELATDAVDALATLQQRGETAVRARLALLPSNCRPAVGKLREAGAECIVYPGVGLVYALWPKPSDAAVAVKAVTDAAVRFRADARFERLPFEHRQRLDVFGVGVDLRAAVERMRALKQRFDPAGVLNPGRFMGRL